jgi:DeoR/GlpR family transcriptional regulator of sugar metabolism
MVSIIALGDAESVAKSEARRAKIVELTENHGYCTTAELARILGVSDMTVRRDIRKLEDVGVLRKVHGGATKPPAGTLDGTQLAARVRQMAQAKRVIAERAAQHLPDSGAVALDAGTTVLQMADFWPRGRVTQVITASLPVINSLADNEATEITCLGGEFRAKSLAFVGPATVAAIAELRIRTLFLAATSVQAGGVYCGNDFDALAKRALVQASDEVILLVDSTKFASSAMRRVCPLSALDRVITDDLIGAEARSWLEDAGVELIACHLRD